MNCIYLLVSLFIVISSVKPDFKTDQLKYTRVIAAYNEKEDSIKINLQKNSINISEMEIYIRIFKLDEILELWAKNKIDTTYKLIEKYNICSLSGDIGPKRRQGDRQIPEGFYHIDKFNPWSSFYLSLKINYPNNSDKILGIENHLGGDIFIHGSCVTIGCIPITDDKIKELYIYCLEAKNNGQSRIPVRIYPTKLTNSNLEEIENEYSYDSDRLNLWSDLKKAYDYFEISNKLPTITFLSNGRHRIE